MGAVRGERKNGDRNVASMAMRGREEDGKEVWTREVRWGIAGRRRVGFVGVSIQIS